MPSFAVVGHPNKGKSSIVATLAENEAIGISPIPGTTSHSEEYALRIDGQTLYSLVDTPGFQRAKAVLDWLQEHADNASERPDVVHQFVAQHRQDPRFHDECELLKPILAGAGILYVVDGTKPYGPEFEIEMQILQWTGQPRMALVNLIGEGDYLADWHRALGQYFSIVRNFDAMHATFEHRINLLGAFAELNESWRTDMQTAIGALQRERQQRLASSARELYQCLQDCLTYTEDRPLSEAGDVEALSAELRQRLFEKVSRRERQAHDRVQAIYRHERLARESAELELLATDIFTEQGWQLFGLSRTQLLITGTMTGALSGLGIDALVGGSSLLLGTGIGAVIGGLTSWFAGDELAKAKVLGTPLGGQRVQVGPIHANNFPWVLLGRAWVHHQLVRERNHAWRAALQEDLKTRQNMMDALPDELRKRLAQGIRQLGRSDGSAMLDALEELLSHPLELDVTDT